MGKVTTLLVICSFDLYYSQFFALNFLLLAHPKNDYLCKYVGTTDYVTCNETEACSDQVEDFKFVYDEDGNKESFPNWYEDMGLTCVNNVKVKFIPISYVISCVLSLMTSSW